MITFSYSYGQLSNPGHIPYPIYFSLLGLLYLSDCLSIHVRQFLISFTYRAALCSRYPTPHLHDRIQQYSPLNHTVFKTQPEYDSSPPKSQPKRVNYSLLAGGISPVLASAADLSALRMKC